MTERTSALNARDGNGRWIGEGIALQIARPALVCGLRKPETIGYELLPIGPTVKTTVIMLAGSSILNFPVVTWIVGGIAGGDDWSLRIFALAFCAVGIWLHYRRKREKWNPQRPHRLNPGISHFTFLPLPDPSHVYRFVDPLVAFLGGALMRYRLGCPLLGLYFMITAGALATFEWQLHQQTEKHEWILGDGPKESARDAEAMKAMAERPADGQLATGVALPTDMDARLQADIEKRRKAQEGAIQ